MWNKFFEVFAAVVVFVVPLILYLMEKAGASLKWIFVVGWLAIAVAALYLAWNIPWVWTPANAVLRLWRLSLVSAAALLIVAYGAIRIWPQGSSESSTPVPTAEPPQKPPPKAPALASKSIIQKDGFTILIPVDTANPNMPIPLDENPEDVHSKFYRALTFSLTDYHPSESSGYLMLQRDQLFSEEGRPKFLGKLIQMYMFNQFFYMTREGYGVELRGGRVTPLEDKTVIPPDMVSSPTNHLIADLARHRLLNGELESRLKNFPLHLPKGANVSVSEQIEKDTTIYVTRIERVGFVKFDLTVQPSGNTNNGVLPDMFRSQAAKTIRTYDLIVKMDAVIQVRNDNNFDSDKYAAWVHDTFAELRRRMTF